MRLAYWTGMRRVACSMKTTATVATRMTAITTRNLETPPLPRAMDSRFWGMRATIEVKMSSDMPLPMPRSVMSSPSHIMRPVPAVIVTTMSARLRAELSGMTAEGQLPKSLPAAAVATMVDDCRRPRPMVR